MRFSIDNIRDISNLIRELSVGLTKIDLVDNFEGFEVTLSIPPVTTVKVGNRLKFVPSKRIILRQDLDGVITDGSAVWDINYLYLTNNHATNTVTITVFFMR